MNGLYYKINNKYLEVRTDKEAYGLYGDMKKRMLIHKKDGVTYQELIGPTIVTDKEEAIR